MIGAVGEVIGSGTWAGHVRACFMAMVIVLGVGCQPELERVQGEHIVYEYSDELRPCAGNVEFIDGLVPFLEGNLAVTAPRTLSYAWLTDEDVPRGVKRDAGDMHLAGMANGREAWGEDPVLVHEVAHMVMGEGESAPFFEEGVATAMDLLSPSGGGPRYLAEITFDPRETMTAAGSADVDYAAGGLFVSFLLVRHGPERLRDFYRALTSPFTLERIGGEFQRVYGVSFDAEIETFMEGPPPCEPDHFVMQLSECTGATVPWEDERTWRLAETMSCDTPGVVGGLGGVAPNDAWPSFHAVTLDVPNDAVYMLEIKTTGKETVRFGRCFGCPWETDDTILFNNTKLPLRLEAGKYYVRVNGSSDEANDIDVSLRYLFD